MGYFGDVGQLVPLEPPTFKATAIVLGFPSELGGESLL